MTSQYRALVVAFDGLIADTFPARAHAVAEALAAEGAPVDRARVSAMVPGRSLDETVEALLHADAAARGTVMDYTTRDVAVLRARRAYSAIVAHGLPLQLGASAWISTQTASAVRLVFRTDSSRADVEQLLRLTEFADAVAFIRCADDLPQQRGEPSVRGAWLAIAARCARLQLDRSAIGALETSLDGAAAAREHVSDVRMMSSLME